jgi:cytochrome c oxidase assembly protein subunit 15
VSSPTTRRYERFARFAWAVVAYNVAASAWGAFVRATGSGAGCGEHWPECNGVLLPRAPALETIIEFTHRITAGLATLLVVALAAWGFRAYAKGHPVRAWALASVGFIVSEALIGAGLVLFGLVKDDASPMRAVAMGTHLVNTFLLLAALTVTASYARDRTARASVRGRAGVVWAIAAPLVMLAAAGVTGAIAALGDTLFHAASLAQGMRDDAMATAHMFVRLRALHPLIAGLAAIAVLAAASVIPTLSAEKGVARAAKVVRVAVVAQVVAGVVNLVLLAPVGMQIAHLVLADCVWIAVVALGARALRAAAEEGPREGSPAAAMINAAAEE